MMEYFSFKSLVIAMFLSCVSTMGLYAQGGRIEEGFTSEGGALERLKELGGDKYLTHSSINEATKPCSTDASISKCQIAPLGTPTSDPVWKIFICTDVPLPGCFYTSVVAGSGHSIGSPLLLTITGYWADCPGNGGVHLEIVDIFPQVVGNEDYSCRLEYQSNPAFWGSVIQSARFSVLELLVNEAGIPIGDPLSPIGNVIMYTKNCWRSVVWAQRPLNAPLEQKAPWVFRLDRIPFDAISTGINPKVTTNNGAKTDELQFNKWDYMTIIEPCTGSVCCVEQYRVYWETIDGHKQINSAMCTISIPASDVCTDPCKSVCGELNKGTIYHKESSLLNSVITPNPNSGQITLKLNGTATGALKFEITDISGNIKFEKEVVKNSDEFVIDFNLSNFSNGNYYYRVTQNNVVLSNGNISLQK